MRAAITSIRRCSPLLLALSTPWSLAACAGSATGRGQQSMLSFICDGGSSFHVDVHDRKIRVTTATGVYELEARPSSIGRKYSSAQTSVILDEERAVLVGAGGGPFKRCHAV